MIVPIIAAFATSAGVIMNKIVLSYQKIGHRQFIIILFLFLFLLSALLYPLFGNIYPNAFSLNYLFLLILVIIIASIYNVLYYHAIEKEKVAEVELIMMLSPLSTILIASIFLQTERNLGVFMAGILASLALVLSHLRRYHLKFDSFQKGLLIYLLLYGFEAVLIKNLLFLYSPLALYAIRTFGVLITLTIWFLWVAPNFNDEPRLNFSNFKTKNYLLCLFIAIVGVLQMVLTYYAYADFGVVTTTIVLILAPILTYLGSVIILKERLKKRIVFAAIIILVCIIYTNIIIGK